MLNITGHKLNIIDGMTDKIILSVILSVKIPHHHMISLFLPYVISSVYTKKFFLLAYLRMYFTIKLIFLIKITRDCFVWIFLFFIFPL